MFDTKETRNYKDTLFSSLYYEWKEAEENAKDLYEALTDRTVTTVEKCRLEEVLFREFKNDVAYIMDGKLICFIEHQSTINPNMPLRCLIYAARTYERKTISNEKLIYSSQLLEIPTPEFYVLYNGRSKLKSNHLKLSSAFKEKTDTPKMELEVNVIDINYHRIKGTKLEKCHTLWEYSYLIDKIREYKGDIEKAVNECISQNVLTEYLKFHGSEVINMLFTEYNAEKALEVRGQEEYEKGVSDGEILGILETLIGLVKDGILTLSEAAKRANMTVGEFEVKSGLKA